MVRLPVMDIVRLSVEDLDAYKSLAAILYAVLLATNLGLGWLSQYLAGLAYPLGITLPSSVNAMVFRANLFRFTFFTLLPWLVSTFVLAWVNMQWADWVASRSDRGALSDGRFWPSFMSLLKYWAVVFVILGVALALGEVGEHHTGTVRFVINAQKQAILLPQDSHLATVTADRTRASVLGSILGILVFLLGLWTMIRLLLLPARGAIGEGTSIAACWHATRGTFWSLFRLTLVNGAIFLLGLALSAAASAAIGYVAVDLGWVAAPASLSLAGIEQWIRLPQNHTLSLVRSVLIAPITGTVFFIFTGSIIRAALLLQSAEGEEHAAYARALAAFRPEQSLWR